MTREHLRTAGTLQIFSREDMPDDLRGALPDRSWVARGRDGYMYVLVDKAVDDDERVISLYKLVSGDDPVGPLVSRVRYDALTEAIVTIAEDRGLTEEIDNGDGTFDVRIRDDARADFEPTPDEVKPYLAKVGLAKLYEVAAIVGVPSPDEPTRDVALGESKPSKPPLTSAQVLDAVWRDDEWETTVGEIVAAASEEGYELSEDAAQKALQRGPFEQVRAARGRGGAAVWKRDPSKALP